MASTKAKVSAELRQFIRGCVDELSPQLPKWIKAVGKKNPARAAELTLAMMEYEVPKLARVEQVGDKDRTVRVVVEKVAVEAAQGEAR